MLPRELPCAPLAALQDDEGIWITFYLEDPFCRILFFAFVHRALSLLGNLAPLLRDQLLDLG